MERDEHAKLLRRAMAQAGLTNDDLATALGVSVRTIVNWRKGKDPTMPTDLMQENLRRLLPGYADVGDPVEVALARTELAPWRKSQVLAEYQRHLHEQAREDAATG